MNQDLILIAIGYIITSAFAFEGLLGAIYQNFWYAKGVPRTSKKHYHGKHARKWGTIFFLGFSIYPAVFILYKIKSGKVSFMDFLPYIIYSLIALAFALLSRKYGPNKVK